MPFYFLLSFRQFVSVLSVRRLELTSSIVVIRNRRLSLKTFNMTKPEGQNVKIGTHSGTFHCDEALACYMLKQLPAYKNAEIVRTREQVLLDTCDIVVDVGGVFDPAKHRYDHHQREFNESMNSLNPNYPWKTRLSSAGLVYYYFGRDVIKSLLKEISDEALDVVYKQVYEYFIQEIDGIDNGVPMFEGEPSYRITTNLSSRVANLNPAWNSANRDETEGFYKALELVGAELMDRATYKAEVWWPARYIVQEAINGRYKVHESGEILAFTEGTFCPWKEHLSMLENDLKLDPNIKFVLFCDRGVWRVQAVPVSVGSFVCRVFIWKDWFGLRDEELCKVSGIDGCIFVHSTGFIGGNKTYEGALEMAVQSLKRQNNLAIKESLQC